MTAQDSCRVCVYLGEGLAHYAFPGVYEAAVYVAGSAVAAATGFCIFSDIGVARALIETP